MASKIKSEKSLLTKKLEEAVSYEENNQQQRAMSIYDEIFNQKLIVPDDITEENVKAKEVSVYKLANFFKEKGQYQNLYDLQVNILPSFIDLPKSKVAKIVRTLFDLTTKIEGKNMEHIQLCKHIIEWCEKESRSFLRMRIENKLAELYFKIEKYHDALDILKKLVYELKKKEDKQLIVETQLVESKVYHALENIPKAKAALTSVKTTANSIYVVPLLQAEIDMMSGLIAADEKDYNTAYSYFYETFEGYRSMNDPTAAIAFKFMLFSKIMNKYSDDALNLINSSVALKYQGKEVDAMKEVALANKQQNLLLFEKCKEVFQIELLQDPVIKRHFNYLYNSLLEENLVKIIKPYSEVQIDFVAAQIGLGMEKVLQKLSEMILDEKINGTLDQGRNCLILFSDNESAEIFEHTLDTFKNLDGVLDSLYEKTQKFREKYHN